jgi:hypothetical protein
VPVLRLDRTCHERLWEHLAGSAERVAFLLSDFDPGPRPAFVVRDVRLMGPGDFDGQDLFHLILNDTAKNDVIRWASDANASLVEVHSHDPGWGLARFSGTDIRGLRAWVPHAMWRLERRPYAALVVAGDSFDGLAWVTGVADPVQLEAIRVDDGTIYQATNLTLARPSASWGEDD